MSRERPDGYGDRTTTRNVNRREYNFDNEEDPANYDRKDNFQNRLYKMYEVPASFHKAHIHQQAYKFGVNSISGKEDRRGERCECCDYYVAYNELDLCHPVEIQKVEDQQGRSHVGGSHQHLQNLPVGVSLYFSFIKTVTWYLLIRFILFDLYNMYMSMYGDYCSSLKSDKSSDLCSITVSGYNLKGNEDTHVLDLLNFAFTLVSIAYFIHFKNFQEEQRIEARHESVNEEDFSVILENIPIIIYNRYDEISDATCNHELELKKILEKKIRTWLQTYDKTQVNSRRFLEKELEDLKKEIKKNPRDMTDLFQDIVKKVTICYDLTEIENMDKLREQLISEIEHIDEKQSEEFSKLLQDEDEGPYTKQMRDTTMIQFAPNQIKMINAKYIALCENFLDQGASGKKTTEFKLSHFTGRAIVTLQYQHFREYLIREYEDNPDFIQINDTSISIRRANKPSEIYWFNLALSDDERTTRSRYSWGVLAMVLIISFAVFLGVEVLQSLQSLKTNPHPSILELVKRYLVTASTGILTTAINFLLEWVIQLLAQTEKHKTKSERLTSLVSKMIVSQTINSSFIYLILYFIMPVNPLGQYGLVNKVISVVIVSGFANIATSILRPGDIWARYKNRKAEEKDDPEVLKTVQIKLNQKYEMPKFGIAEGYAFYIVIIFTVSFYGFIVPVATPIAIGVFLVQYWVDKYNLFRRSSPIDFGYMLSKDIFTIFEVSLFFFTFGYFLWDLYIHYDPVQRSVKVKPINIVSLVISAQYAGFYLFVPQAVKNKIIGSQEKMYFESYAYYEKENKFKSTYYSENPATSFLKSEKAVKKQGEPAVKTLEKKSKVAPLPPPPGQYNAAYPPPPAPA